MKNSAARQCDGPRRLAASVLLRALRDYAALTGLRRMRKAERDNHRQEPSTRRRQKMIAEVVEFLCSESPFHALCDIDPESLSAVLGRPERMRQFMRALDGEREDTFKVETGV